MNVKIVLGLAILVGLGACEGSGEPTSAEGTIASSDDRRHDGRRPVARGEPIDVASLEGKIVFDDFEDVFVMDADGTNVRPSLTARDRSSMVRGLPTAGGSSIGTRVAGST